MCTQSMSSQHPEGFILLFQMELECFSWAPLLEIYTIHSLHPFILLSKHIQYSKRQLISAPPPQPHIFSISLSTVMMNTD